MLPHEMRPLNTPHYVVTREPGDIAPPAPGYVWMQQPPPPTVPGVPMGLEYLAQLDTVMVHQMVEPIEMMTGWETENKYVMKNRNGQQCYYALEESGCCGRQFCGPSRSFVIHIVDNFHREVLTLTRDFKCFANGCFSFLSFCQDECVIESPSMGRLGTIRQRFGFFSTKFDVIDAEGNVVLKIDGPCCCLLMGCRDKDFQIKPLNAGESIGAITKKWGGFCREALTDADTFQVDFPIDLDVKVKALLLGATFLIDFMMFETDSDLHS